VQGASATLATMGIPNELLRAVRQHRVVPFVGAGVSIGVKRALFPTWGQLIEQLAVELADQALPEGAQEVRRLAAAGAYLQAAEIACRELRPYLFNRVLRARFRVRRPADCDLAVVEAIWALEPPLVITTNYDDVLRWAGPDEVEVVSNDQDEELALLHEASSGAPWLWHLHGTIRRLGTIILGGADYARLYVNEGTQRAGQYEAALFKLRQTLADRPFLYVGFSLSDPYVLQQIKDVLALTKGKGAPSYALMKRGTGDDAAALRSNFNIQVVAYEDHGRPLAELLQALARQAFQPHDAASAAAPDPAPPPPVSVPRTTLEDGYLAELRASRRLLVLAPRRGGARSVSRSVAVRHFGERVTWLTPPNVPGCTAQQYFSALSGEPVVDDFLKLETWLRARARAAGGEHLIVLRHDGGPRDHLVTLGDTLRKLLSEGRGGAQRFFVMVAGSAPCAWLLYNTGESSLFSGAPVRHVPPLDAAEVRAVLDGAGLDGAAWAADVLRATGGHPGLVEEAVLGRGALDFAALTERLAKSPAVRGVVVGRLLEDDREGRPEKRHARWALRELLAGRPVRALGAVEDQLQYAETRLYYDGLVVAGEGGATVFRCEAARLSAERALAAEDGP
jgi:SIR2-like domain